MIVILLILLHIVQYYKSIMIGFLFKKALRLSSFSVGQKFAHPVSRTSLFRVSSFFSTASFQQTIKKIQSGVEPKDFDTLLQEVSKLENKDHLFAMQLLLQGLNTERIEAQFATKEAFLVEAKKNATIFVNLHVILLSKLSDSISLRLKENDLGLQEANFYMKLMEEYLQACSKEFPKVDQNQKYMLATVLSKTQFYVLFRYLSAFATGEQKIEGLQKCKENYNQQIGSLFKMLEGVKSILEGGDEKRLKNISRVVSQLMNIVLECCGFHYECIKQIYKDNQNKDEFKAGNFEARNNIDNALKLFQEVYGKSYLKHDLFIIEQKRLQIEYQLNKLKINDLTSQQLDLEFASKLQKLNDQLLQKLSQNQISKLTLKQLYEILFTILRQTQQRCDLESKTKEQEYRAEMVKVGEKFLSVLSKDQKYQSQFKSIVKQSIEDFISKIKENQKANK